MWQIISPTVSTRVSIEIIVASGDKLQANNLTVLSNFTF